MLPTTRSTKIVRLKNLALYGTSQKKRAGLSDLRYGLFWAIECNIALRNKVPVFETHYERTDTRASYTLVVDIKSTHVDSYGKLHFM